MSASPHNNDTTVDKNELPSDKEGGGSPSVTDGIPSTGGGSETEIETPKDETPKPKIIKPELCVEIPKIVHFVWVGNPLPTKYQDNIKNWRDMNPDYEIKLWIDRDLLTTEQLEEMKKYAEKNKITLVDIVDKINDENNPVWSKADLSVYYDNVVGENRNWGIASNVLRMHILFEEGGLYLDTDISPKKPLDKLLAPPHGLLLRAIFSPVDDVSAALADNIMASTKNNVIIQEMSKVIIEKYANFLENNESVVEMRSRILSDITQPTYEIVGPDVLAEAYVNLELNRIPFGPFLNREKIKDKIVDDGFFVNVCDEFFDTYFIEEFDNTWISKGDDLAGRHYTQLLRNAVFEPLSDTLNKIISDSGVELNKQFMDIKKIADNKDEYPNYRLKRLYETLSQDPKLLHEMRNYVRGGYLTTLVSNHSVMLSKLDSLFKGKDQKDQETFMENLKQYVDTYKKFTDQPRRLTNPILNEAAKAQGDKIKQTLSNSVQETLNRFLSSAIRSSDETLVSQLLELGANPTNRSYYHHANDYQLAVERKDQKITAIILKSILGKFENLYRGQLEDVLNDLKGNTPPFVIKVGNTMHNPIILEFYSKENNKTISKPISFNFKGELVLTLEGEKKVECANLESLIDTIQRDNLLAPIEKPAPAVSFQYKKPVEGQKVEAPKPGVNQKPSN